MRTVYVYIHIPKNAGQTFTSILKRYFRPDFDNPPELTPGRILSEAEKHDYVLHNPNLRCVAGHAFRYPGPVLPGVRYKYLTVLREPVARLVSLYAYEQQNTPAGHSSHGPIEGWIDHRLTEDNALTNFQAFHLLGVRDPAEVDLQRAQRRLDSFDFVGLADQFDDSLLLLARRLRLSPYDLYYRTLNATHSRERFPLSPAIRQRLLDLNAVDQQLYDYARRRFAAELAAIPPRRLAAERARLARITALERSEFPRSYKLLLRLRRFWRKVETGGFARPQPTAAHESP